jgi:hypothetical protein
VKDKKVINKLTLEEQQINNIIADVRGKVEGLYSWVKRHFLALSKPFYEDKKQHDYVVKVAFICHTLILN